MKCDSTKCDFFGRLERVRPRINGEDAKPLGGTLGFVFYQVSQIWGERQVKSVKLSALFEPTLQSSTMIYTIHGFTAGVFTPPSGEQGRLRRTNNPEEHTLAGSQVCLFGFRLLCSLSKVPLKSSSP